MVPSEDAFRFFKLTRAATSVSDLILTTTDHGPIISHRKFDSSLERDTSKQECLLT